MVRTATYKPLLLTTTVRNPERFKIFLNILSDYEGKNLSEEVIYEVICILIKKGHYCPTKVSPLVKQKWKNEEDLTDEETFEIIKNNPQNHKEAGFPKGWPSRFDTWFSLGRRLGLIFYEYEEKIIFSESGKLLSEIEKSENELLVFANAFSKYQTNNPFSRVLNKFLPLSLLIKTIKKLKYISKSAGIAKHEIPILLSWQNNDADALCEKILSLRDKFGFQPSKEVIMAECATLLDDIVRDDNWVVDYTDDFIRKMRLTGLISLRGGGRFIDLNNNEIEAINYIEENYSKIKDFKDENDFFSYMGAVDQKLVSLLSINQSTYKTTSSKDLEKWSQYFSWETVKNELLKLARKAASSDDILKLIKGDLRLEFLVTLAIYKNVENIHIISNYLSDDEGLPTSVAPGGRPDIICNEEGTDILVEVTLLTGTQQHIRESFSIRRHLEAALENNEKSFAIMVSPKTNLDFLNHSEWIKHSYNLEVRASEIATFVEEIEDIDKLRELALS